MRRCRVIVGEAIASFSHNRTRTVSVWLLVMLCGVAMTWTEQRATSDARAAAATLIDGGAGLLAAKTEGGFAAADCDAAAATATTAAHVETGGITVTSRRVHLSADPSLPYRLVEVTAGAARLLGLRVPTGGSTVFVGGYVADTLGVSSGELVALDGGRPEPAGILPARGDRTADLDRSVIRVVGPTAVMETCLVSLPPPLSRSSVVLAAGLLRHRGVTVQPLSHAGDDLRRLMASWRDRPSRFLAPALGLTTSIALFLVGRSRSRELALYRSLGMSAPELVAFSLTELAASLTGLPLGWVLTMAAFGLPLDPPAVAVAAAAFVTFTAVVTVCTVALSVSLGRRDIAELSRHAP